MATHKMVFKEETADMAVFECDVCHRPINFHKPDTGRVPAAAQHDGSWILPENSADIVAQTLGDRCDG